MREIARLEKEYNKDLLEILLELGKVYRNLLSLADALEVSYQLLVYWLEEKFGIKREDFYRCYICKNKCIILESQGDFRYKV